MRTAIVIAAGCVALVASAAAQAKQTPDQKFCAAATSFQSDTGALNAMGPHATVAEVRTLHDKISEDAAELRSAASKMNTDTAKRFTTAMNQLDKDLNNIPDDATLQQVSSKIQADAQSARDAGTQLASEAGCPAPAEAPQGQPPQPTQP